MSGLVARNYKKGSIIYFEGDLSDEIFILKSGRIVLTTLIVETGVEAHEELKAGEFFGVKSSLGHYPREETAQTAADASVLVMKPAQFEQLMSKNFRLVMKMLKVFSNQLRSVGKRVRDILGDTDLKSPATELLKLGEYYYQHNKIEYAKFVYTKFLSLYPGNQFEDRAQLMLKSMEMGQPFPGRYATLYEDSDEVNQNANTEMALPEIDNQIATDLISDSSAPEANEPDDGLAGFPDSGEELDLDLESSQIDFNV